MAKKGVIALIACVFALSLALVGCAPNQAAKLDDADSKAAFVGTWDLVEMSQDGEVTGSDDLETLKALGLEVFVNFNEDDTMVLALFGEPIEGTWTAESTTAGTIEMEGQTVSMSIADSKLTFEQEGASLTFEKGEAKEAPTASSADESATTETESSEAVEESAESTEAEASEAATEAEAEAESAEASEEASESAETESTEASEEATESESSSSSAAA